MKQELTQVAGKMKVCMNCDKRLFFPATVLYVKKIKVSHHKTSGWCMEACRYCEYLNKASPENG